MTRRRVRFTATAREHVRHLKQWWQENAARPEILHHDMEEALKMLSALPWIGSSYPSAPMTGVRRFYLERLMSHLYYTFDERELVIRVSVAREARLGTRFRLIGLAGYEFSDNARANARMLSAATRGY